MPDLSSVSAAARVMWQRLHDAVDLIIASLWVATCAVAPEFIWQGACESVNNLNWTDLAGALLVGLVLAFCIEPTLERLRHAWGGPGHAHELTEDVAGRRPNLLFPAAVAFAFAFASVCMHSALTAFLATHAEARLDRQVGLANGLWIAGASTLVPFCVCLAWLTAWDRPWRWLTGLLAILSPVLATWAFRWSFEDWVTTQIPSFALLAGGYYVLPRRAGRLELPANLFRQAAKMLAVVATLWMLAAALIDWIMTFSDSSWTVLYTPSEFWVDARFYLGWFIGLMIAPVPRGLVAQR